MVVVLILIVLEVCSNGYSRRIIPLKTTSGITLGVDLLSTSLTTQLKMVTVTMHTLLKVS